MGGALAVSIPICFGISVGFGVRLRQGWLLGLLWGAVTYVVLLAVVLAIIRLRRHRRSTRG